MNKSGSLCQSCGLTLLVIIIGLGARLLVAARGHNFDMDSWRIVLDIMDRGGNVYDGTARYNYGPIWFNLLHGLNLLAWHNETLFRYFLSGFLSLVDVGIFFILWRKFGRLAALLFYLNPISIIVTGYCNQFDNLAILLGLLAAWLVGDEFDQPIGRRKFLGLLVLGLSLATKHLLFAFPIWLAIKQKGMLQKLVVILVPAAVFIFSFVPYWHEGKQGIIENVFLFRSYKTEYFYTLLMPKAVHVLASSLTVWLFLLVVFAFIHRQKSTIESLLLYTCALVAFSPSTVGEYLAISVPFVSVYLNAFTILYTVSGTLFLLVNGGGLHLTDICGFHIAGRGWERGCMISVYILLFTLVWVTWSPQIMKLLEKCIFEAKNQLGLKK